MVCVYKPVITHTAPGRGVWHLHPEVAREGRYTDAHESNQSIIVRAMRGAATSGGGVCAADDYDYLAAGGGVGAFE